MNIFWGIVVLVLFWLGWRYRHKWQTDLNSLFRESPPKKFNRILRKTGVNGYVISTVRLPYAEMGIQDDEFLGLPYETQVFTPSGDSVEELRYENELQALAGHKNLVGKYTFKPCARCESE